MKAVFNWSGGKDSALALYHCLKNNDLEIESLLTTISESNERITMHGVRNELLLEQAKSIGIDLVQLAIPEKTNLDAYNKRMQTAMDKIKKQGIEASVFGDIFLEDLKEFREKQLAKVDLKAVFPLWGRSTKEIAEEFIKLGFKTIVSCVSADKLDKSFCGRIFDDEFLSDLPADVDPCGENGEFHTFVFEGPIFSKPIKFTKGEVVYRSYPNPEKDNNDKFGFWYCDLQ